MKNIMKNGIAVVCFLLLLGFALDGVGSLCERKDSDKYFGEFWADPEEYDVLFFGSSHGYYMAQPLLLWKEYGIRSYNLASAGSRMPQTYWTLRCALQESRPEVVVIDTYRIEQSKKTASSDKNIHAGLDAIPFSLTKVRAVLDMFDTLDKQVEYIWPFYIYHNRWTTIKPDELKTKPVPLKGGHLRSEIQDNSGYSLVGREEMTDGDTVGYEYLKKCIELCRAENVELVLTAVPCCTNADTHKAMNRAECIAREYGVPFLNISYEDNPLDNRCDFADAGHYNLMGTKKMTAYLGRYLADNYDLADYRKDGAAAEEWEASYDDFISWCLKKVSKGKKLENRLMWLSLLDEYYDCSIYLDEKYFDDEVIKKEFDFIGSKEELTKEKAEEMLNEEVQGDGVLILQDKDNGEVVYKAVFRDGKLLY